MADILIRGVEMPETCCGCFANEHMFCNILKRKLRIPKDYTERPQECKLEEYLEKPFQAEKDRHLVVPPCNVGDIVYAIVHWMFASTPTVLPTTVRSVTIHDDHISVEYDRRINTIDDCGVWGKSVFSTREEANAALEARKND